MNLHKILTLLIVTFVLPSLDIRPLHADENSPFEKVRVIIHGDDSPGPYETGRKFIGGTAAVDTLISPGLSVESTDVLSGTVTFTRTLAAWDSAAVILAVPPKWLRSTFTRPVDTPISGPGLTTSYENYLDKTPKTFPGLRFGGSKTFDISTGSDRTTALNQSLRLNISGNLSDDISLIAAISDQNVPISPEGDTRELNELDRIMIELKGPRFTLDMGDTDLKNEGGRWLTYSRRLSGARAGVKVGNMEVFGSGAISEGRYMSATINAVEGNQGPYRLNAETGRTDISIIPGTERVWINGDPLSRGANDDYVIDYTTGELTFTENRIIGSDMRIVCDYEYTSDSYRRTFYSAGTDGVLNDGKLKVNMVYAREADASDRPVLGEMNDGIKSLLSQSGDSQALASGLRPAEGDSTGTYDIVNDHLVYNPLKKGTHNATFSWIGEDSGSYRYKGGGVYEFVSPGDRLPGSGASYDPVALIDTPVSHTLAGVRLAYTPTPSVTIESEVAGSTLDRNTLSDMDDSDNGGGAYRLAFSASPEFRAIVPMKMNVAGNHRTRGQSFAPLDRDRAAEENRDWGLPLVWRTREESVSEFTGGLSVNDGGLRGSGIDFNGGRAEFGGTALSSKAGATGRLSMGDRGSVRLSMDSIERTAVPLLPDEEITRVYGAAGFKMYGISPSILYDSERAEGIGDFSHGAAYDEVRARLDSLVIGRVIGEMEWMYRKEQMKKQAWADSSTARGGSIGFKAGNGITGMLRTRYARREWIGKFNKMTSDQGLIEGYYKPSGGKLSLDVSYRAGSSREASVMKNYLYAGGDRGNFRWEDHNNDSIRDPDEFVPDEHGSYYLYEETLDDYRPVNVVRAYSRVGAELPSRLTSRLIGFAIPVQLESSFEVNEKSTSPASDVFLLKLGSFRKKGKTTSGDSRIQEDITIPIGDDGSVRFRYFRSDTYDAEYVSGAERRGDESRSIRLRLPVSGSADAEFTVTNALYRRIMEIRSSGDYSVNSTSGDAGISYYPRSTMKISMNGGGGFDRDNISNIEATFYTMKPSATYFFSGKGKIEGSYAITSVTLANYKIGRILPHTMARGRKDGQNHDISIILEYRLSQRMNCIVSYTGRKFADRDFENFARAQVRAMF